MEDLLKEAFSLAEADARWLDDAARYFEDYASQLSEGEKAKWQLLAAVYRERAQLSKSVAGKVRQNQRDMPDVSPEASTTATQETTEPQSGAT
jgi:hypothetical protein